MGVQSQRIEYRGRGGWWPNANRPPAGV